MEGNMTLLGGLIVFGTIVFFLGIRIVRPTNRGLIERGKINQELQRNKDILTFSFSKTLREVSISPSLSLKNIQRK